MSDETADNLAAFLCGPDFTKQTIHKLLSSG